MNDVSGVIAIFLVFLVPGSIIYYLLKTRHAEMNAMIDKGMDVSVELQRRSATPYRLATMAIGVGIGLIVAMFIEGSAMNINDDILYPACVFLFGGLGLLFSGKIAGKFS